jgi:ubiquinone/menaquinone biosynthesis C-methylase UbiE
MTTTNQTESPTGTDVTAAVRAKYGEAARRVLTGSGTASCGTSPSADAGGCGCGCDPVSTDLYDASQIAGLPADAVGASLGCGNPTALAELQAGEIVLDLGSGGGIDVLLSARRVGPTGKAYGLDTTDDMLALAEANRQKSGLTNVEFLRGTIEHIPLPDASVDVIISNCVINLSGDKDGVIAEAFRVLKPGGRFAVSDVVVRGTLPEPVRHSMELWVGCVAGALSEDEYRSKLAAAGFTSIDLEVTREYSFDDARSFLAAEGLNPEELAREVVGRVVSAFVRATKPVKQAEKAEACCGPTCCG